MNCSTDAQVRQHLRAVAGRQPPGLQRGVGLRLRRRGEPLAQPEAVADHRQGPGGGDPRVLLAQRAGRGVAGVGEHGPAGVPHRLVEPLEGLHGEEHLAAHLDPGGHRVVGRAGQPVRHVADRPDVGGDVLTGPAVAAGDSPDQPAALVEQVDRQAVDLELAQHRRVRDAVAGQPRPPALQLVVGEGVVQAHHRLEVVHGGELRGDRAADLLRRRVRGAQLGELLLELLQTAHPHVEVVVGQRRVVEHVVAPPGVLDLLGQGAVLVAGLRRRDGGLRHAPILPCATDSPPSRGGRAPPESSCVQHACRSIVP